MKANLFLEGGCSAHRVPTAEPTPEARPHLETNKKLMLFNCTPRLCKKAVSAASPHKRGPFGPEGALSGQKLF